MAQSVNLNTQVQNAVKFNRDKANKQQDAATAAEKARNNQPNQSSAGEPKGVGAAEKKAAADSKKIRPENNTANTRNPVAVQTQKGQSISQRY